MPSVTILDQAADEPDLAAGDRRPITRSRVLRLTVGLMVISLVIIGAVRWRNNPDLVMASGSGVYPKGVPLSEAAYAINIADPIRSRGSESLTLKSTSARVVTNTAAARIGFSICVARPGTGIGVVRPAELGTYCSRLIPVRHDTKLVASDSARQVIVLTVVPTKVGLVRLDRLNITYRRDWKHLYQSGSLRTGIDVAIRVIPSQVN